MKIPELPKHKKELSFCICSTSIIKFLASQTGSYRYDASEIIFISILHNPKALRGYTAVIPTLLAGGAMHEHPYEDTPANHIIIANSRYVAQGSNNAMKTSVENGIAVGVGTDSSVPFCTPYNTYMELVKMQQLTNLDALEIIDIATRETAMILNIDNETGTLDKGKAADFIVLDKNPLEDLKNIKKPEQVVARGRHYAHPSFKEYPGIE